MSLVFGAIAPHGGMAIPEAVAPEVAVLAARTTAALEELGRDFDAARPQAVIILTPHSVHVEGAMAVVVAGRVAGSLEGSRLPIALNSPTDRDLADRALSELRGVGIPAVGVSYGGNNPEEAVMPMDWAVLIPHWFMGGRSSPPVPVVVVAPARDLPPEAHIQAGAALARAAASGGKRVAIIASADHGHAHQATGPYGYDPRAKIYDDRIVDIVRSGRLDGLIGVSPVLVAGAKADSWWQMLMLHGALGQKGRGELLSYEAPTYFGMLCARYSFVR